MSPLHEFRRRCRRRGNGGLQEAAADPIMPAMRPSRLAVAATLLLLLTCVAVAGSWLWARQALEQGIARWRAEQVERGYTIDYAGPRFSGFPFVLAVSFERSEEHTSELQSLMRISYAVFCLK